MAERILVAYATRYGSTAEVAEAIADELQKSGEDVDLRQISEVQDLAPYRAAIIGSPIYMGKWLPEPQVFVERYQRHLRGIPVACFAVGLTVAGKSPTPGDRRKAEASMDQIRMLVNPVDIGSFPGRLEIGSLSEADRAIIKLIGVKPGDFRDLEAVRAWTRALRTKLDRHHDRPVA
jgi:menaquinone-dependent protoporphyrinogen oxidase